MGAQRWLVKPGQGRRGPVGFLGEVDPHGYLDEKEESGCWGRRGVGESSEEETACADIRQKKFFLWKIWGPARDAG